MKKRFFVKRICNYNDEFISYRISYYDCLDDAKSCFYEIYSHFIKGETCDDLASAVVELCDNEDYIVLLDAVFDWNC